MPHQEKHSLRASVRAEDGVKVRVSRLDAARVGNRGSPHRRLRRLGSRAEAVGNQSVQA
jgi:hypothetical protein